MLAATLPAAAQQVWRWPDTFVARLEVLALLQTMNADILASRSATRTLEDWCAAHHLAAEAKIVAYPVADTVRAPTAEQRLRLQITATDDVKYRRVQLRCGVHVLSEADNWYVPARLTPDMNRLLETTGTPFGKVVEALEPWRQTLAVKMLWSPLPDNWESAQGRYPSAPRRALTLPAALFEHRALLYTRDHQPFAEVVETYQRDLLAFPPPTLH
jgi:chorismate-pyruvate lyase